MRRLVFCLLSSFFISMSAGAWAADAVKEDPTLANLQKMVYNLGYTTTLSPTGRSFRFKWQANNYSFIVNLQVDPKKTIAYAYVNIDDYDQQELTKLNLVKLLEANNAADFYFSLMPDLDGKTEDLLGNAIIPLNGITPEDLRLKLSVLIYYLDTSGDLWDKELWKKKQAQD